ncbi:MAG: radical SAM protein, partial [Promethearchaeota archaeon]
RLRKMLLSNGTLIDEEMASQLKDLVNEVQISIDGTDSHNNFRDNPHSLQKALQAIKNLNAVGLDVSVATMVHSQNLKELPALEKVLKDLQVKSWALDIPSQTGEFLKHPDLYPSIEEAGAALRNFGWGAPFEETHNIYACGAHLCAIMPNGDVIKCGFFGEKPVSNLNVTNLADCWRLIQKKFIWKQEELECASLNCPHLQDCRGGCRFRASVDSGRLIGIDRVKCAAFNFKYPKK